MAKKKARAKKKPEPQEKVEVATDPVTVDEVCPLCKRPLIALPWGQPEMGQRSFILACNNAACERFRNPVRSISKEAPQKQGPKRKMVFT
jgi:hypothetical protein